MTPGLGAQPPKNHSIPGLTVTFVTTSSFTDPHSPFVTQKGNPEVIFVYAHKTTLIVPCRTTSPDAVVTLEVRPYFCICT